MKIMMLTWEYPPRIIGGISRVVEELSKRLVKQGHEVHVITWLESDTNQYDTDEGVNIHRVHSYNINACNFIDNIMHLNFAIIEKGAELVQKLGKFDIIHAHDWLVVYAAKALKHAYHIPLVSTIHATEYGRNHGIHNEQQKYINDAEWLLTYESWKIICNSDFMKQEIEHIFSVDKDKIYMIPNGIDVNKFDRIEKDFEFRRNYASDNEKIVMFAGRLVQEKGVHVLIEAIPKILTYYNDVKFIIAGKGPKYDELLEYSNQLGLSSRVYFTGHLNGNDLYKLYKCADVAVFPSLYEPFGLVALEGMLANVPVVVSEAGGLDEIVEHNVNGFKSYIGNANSLADSILEVLFNTEKVESVTQIAKQKVLEYYNWDRIAKLTNEVYHSVSKEYKKSKWSKSYDKIEEGKNKENTKKIVEKSIKVEILSNKKLSSTKNTKKVTK